MNVPKLRFKEFDGEWEEKDIIHIAQDEKSAVKIGPFGSQLRKEYLQSAGLYKVYGQENVFNNDFSQGNRFLNEERFNLLKSSEIISGDIVISMMGTIGKIAEVPSNIQVGIMDSHLIRIRLDNQKYLNSFFIQVMNSTILKKQIEKLSVGSIMSGLSSKVIKTLQFPYTKIEEQKKISKFLNLLDKKIQLQQQKIDLLQEQKKGYMQKMFPKAGETQPEMRFDGFTGDWEQHKLGDIAKVIDPHPSHRAPEATKQGVPFIGIGDVDELGNINYNSARIVDEKIYEEHRGRYDLSIPSIGIGRVASLGKVIRLRNDTGKYTISPTLSIIQFDSQNNLDFLYFCMNTDVFQKQFKSFSNGSTRQSVGIQDLRTLQINLPTEQNEQENIGEFLSELQKKIQFELKKLETLKIQKQGFMQQMFI